MQQNKRKPIENLRKMKKQNRKRYSNPVPFDVIADEILPRLPVKSLVRFTSVCKTWNSHIKSPSFIANHLNIHRYTDKVQNLIVLHRRSFQVRDAQTLDWLGIFDARYFKNRVVPMESCNGLIFLYRRHTCRYMLWNPSIKKVKTLDTIRKKLIHYKDSPDTLIIHGLGFHESTNDHRVVRIVYAIDKVSHRVSERVPTKVDVYSLSTDSWHSVHANPGRFVAASTVADKRAGLYLNGAIHLFSSTRVLIRTKMIIRNLYLDPPEYGGFESILLFDFEDECFREMGLPQGFGGWSNKCFGGLKELEGCLAFLFRNSGCRPEYSVWVMIEYGDSESWTRKYIINTPGPGRYPSGFTQRGMLVIGRRFSRSEARGCELLDIESGRKLRRFRRRGYFIDFMESLVLL